MAFHHVQCLKKRTSLESRLYLRTSRLSSFSCEALPPSCLYTTLKERALLSVQNASDFNGRHCTMLVFYTCVKSHKAFAGALSIKGPFCDPNTRFLWHSSVDIFGISLFPNFQSIPRLRLWVIHILLYHTVT